MHRPEPGPERWRTVLRTRGEVFVTGGLVVLLFVVHELFVTDLLTDRKQSELSQQLHEVWDRAPVVLPVHESKVGNAFPVLHIPRSGPDYECVVLEGTAEEQLSPTPNAAADAAPTGAYLTLTTCHPRYSAQQWLIIHARLDGGAITKAEQPHGPAALHER